MLFAIICTDKPDHGHIRAGTRPDHLAYLADLGERVRMAGPFTDETGDKMTGSLIVLEADTANEAREIAALDPYARAGLFETVDIRPWNWVITDGKPR
ncbi:YciI family protein [Kaustia mangrovi]|uniref:YciI family protein n=1 Tax=Kaustia mangrovi TaxID=2593653 RepID=A0A7S8C4H1_9HYPH|nr:YciI family protein [Kaustia mangrovi]QPC43240.1 YciI family protein [Kaustia mangrovi]